MILWKNTVDRYGLITISFHWLMAAIVLFLIPLGLYMVGLPDGLLKLKLIGIHKEFGLLIFFLIWLRICWRATNVLPRLPSSSPHWQNVLARAVHLTFYVLLVIMPLTGWLLSSAAGFSVSFFGLFVMPDLISPNKELANFFVALHQWLAFSLIALICIHVAAALIHHFIYKDNVLKRIFYLND